MKSALFLILFTPIMLSAACLKEVKVIVYSQKMLPSLLDFSKKKNIRGEKMVTIDCLLYNDLKIGDILVDKSASPEISIKGSIFDSPLDEIRYEVISK